MITRRQFLARTSAGALAASAPGLLFAKGVDDARFVLVILRGAADGLAIAAPYADPAYRSVRGDLALAKPGNDNGVNDLDGFFGLHPALERTHALFRNQQASIIHAVASPYRERSHFDGQDVLENGADGAGSARDGWLNRALAPLGGSLGDETAIALAQNTPLVLRGAASVTSWAPSRLPDAESELIERLRLLYADDEFFAVRLEQALESQRIASGMDETPARGARGGEQLINNLTAAANFLRTDDGPRIAVVEAGGWDTHANQGASAGALANQLRNLDRGVAALESGLGEDWQNTVVAIVTEFGRTVRVNGTRGTDHGTASAAILAGGALRGGQVIADWPGLADRNLYEGRDLAPTMDLRGVFKGVLIEHLDLPPAFVEREVFPDSKSAVALRDIVIA